MTAQYKGKVFKSGNSVAVRLPKGFGFEEGDDITLEQKGAKVVLARDYDPDAALANNRALVEEIRAIWDAAGGPPPPEKRNADIFPDRPGLY
jgi:antitoxin VapB